MKKKLITILAAVGVVFGGIFVTPSIAHAGGSDSPTPYTVTSAGVQLPVGDSFRAHGHINWSTTKNASNGMHFDPNNGHPGGAYIGKAFFPISLEPGECVTWVQISHYNEHFGEGGQEPVCAPSAEPEPPIFDGVTKYTPTHGSTCELATFSHPNFKSAFGVANVFGVRYGATQAEAQAKPFEDYTPGTTVTLPFADPYISNAYYFEFKVGYNGVDLTHQIGQSKSKSTACDKPKPEKPQDITGDEQRNSDPVCVVPADGTEVSYLENRIWTQEWVWDESSWDWVLEKRVYGEWELADTIVNDNEECEPEKEEPPVVPEDPKTPVDTPTTPVKVETASNELAVTGSSSNIGIFTGIGLLVAGIAAFGVKLLRKRVNV